MSASKYFFTMVSTISRMERFYGTCCVQSRSIYVLNCWMVYHANIGYSGLHSWRHHWQWTLTTSYQIVMPWFVDIQLPVIFHIILEKNLTETLMNINTVQIVFFCYQKPIFWSSCLLNVCLNSTKLMQALLCNHVMHGSNNHLSQNILSINQFKIYQNLRLNVFLFWCMQCNTRVNLFIYIY